MMTKQKLNKIKQFMPVGSQQKIADDLGLSYSYVNKCMNGDRRSLKVWAAAAEIADTYKFKITEKTLIKKHTNRANN